MRHRAIAMSNMLRVYSFFTLFNVSKHLHSILYLLWILYWSMWAESFSNSVYYLRSWLWGSCRLDIVLADKATTSIPQSSSCLILVPGLVGGSKSFPIALLFYWVSGKMEMCSPSTLAIIYVQFFIWWIFFCLLICFQLMAT